MSINTTLASMKTVAAVSVSKRVTLNNGPVKSTNCN